MEIHYTAKATKALSLARKYAKDLQHGYVGTEHLLLGLLKEGTGVAAKVLSGNRAYKTADCSCFSSRSGGERRLYS